MLTLALLWVYLRRHDNFARFRNTLLLANVIGLLGYVAMPTAPPRLLGLGFVDEPHKDGLVQLAANPYAAMPSLHAADALIVGDRARVRLPPLVGEALLGDLAGSGSGSPSWRPATTSGSTASPASASR